MPYLLQLGLSNAVMAAALAVLAAVVGFVFRRPALTHSLWLLVLLKLITPPLLNIRVPWPERSEPGPTSADASRFHEQPLLRSNSDQTLEPAPFSRSLLRARSVSVQDTVRARRSERLNVESAVESAADKVASEKAYESLLDASLPALHVDADDEFALGPLNPPAPPAIDGAEVETAAPWILLVSLFWPAGAALWFVLIAVRSCRFYRLLICACPAPQHLCARVHQLAEVLGLAHPPSVWLVPGRISPLLWVFGGRARLLIPAALWDRLDADQQRTLLVHELAHLRRGDQWVRCLEILVTGFYWWHPVVWWARREIREAEEQCCDAWVVWALPRAARAYATALVETVDFLSETRTALPVAASGIGQVHDLRRRINMIMRGTTPRALSAAGFLAVLCLGALLLPLLPTWAQQIPNEGQEPRERQVQGSREGNGQRQESSRHDPKARRNQREGELQGERQRVERFAHEVEAQQQRLQELMGELQKAQEDLRRKEQETQLRLVEERRRRAENLALAQKAPPAGSRREAPRDLEHRLGEVERKLDILLSEVQGLRRELRRGHESPPHEGPGLLPGERRPGPAVPGTILPQGGRPPVAFPPRSVENGGPIRPGYAPPGGSPLSKPEAPPESPVLPSAPQPTPETPPPPGTAAPAPVPTPPVSRPERSPAPSRS